MKLKLKDPGSAITHGIAMLLAIAGAMPLLLKTARSADTLHLVALSVFILTMILLYAASTIYHSVDSTEKVNRRLRKIDHMMIFIMIAGSYTPVCLIALHNKIGYILCALVWGDCHFGNASQRLMDHLSQMGILCPLYRHGLALCFGIYTYFSVPAEGRLWLASCRRYYLYDWRCYLWVKASDF